MGIKTPYAGLGNIEMPVAVEARLRARLADGQRRAYRFQRLRYGAYAAASLAVSALSLVSISSALSQAGAYDFIALAWSDSAALSYSKEIFLSVAESLPVLGLALLLAGALASALTLPRFVRRQPQLLYA